MDITHFEPLHQALPYGRRTLHPDGSLVAMQAYAQLPRTGGPDAETIRKAAMHVLQKMKKPVTPEMQAFFGVKDASITESHLRGAIWNVTSGALVWAPDNAIALAWLRDGHEVALLRERHDPPTQRPPVFGSPLQSEFTYAWERYSWPKKELLSSCPIFMPTGWPTTLTISPRSDLAIFQWKDQEESGLEFVAISDDGDHQMLQTALPILDNVTDLCFRSGGNGFPLGSSLVAPPVFSPDGRFLVIAWQVSWIWWAEESQRPRAEQASEPFPQRDDCQNTKTNTS